MTNREVRIYASVVQLGVCAAAAAVCSPEEGGGCVQRNDGSRIVFGTNRLFEESDENIGLRSGEYATSRLWRPSWQRSGRKSRGLACRRVPRDPEGAAALLPKRFLEGRFPFSHFLRSFFFFVGERVVFLPSFSGGHVAWTTASRGRDMEAGPAPWRSSEGGNRSGGKDDVNAALGALKRQALRTGCARGCGRNLPFAKGGILRAPVKAFPASSVR